MRASAVFALVALAVVGAVVIVWDRVLNEVTTPVDPAASDVTLIVPRGADERHVLRLLHQGGLVSPSRWVDTYVARMRVAGRVVPGEYRLSAASSVDQLFDTVASGRVVTHTVVVRPGATAEAIGAELERASIVSRRAFVRAVRDPGVARVLGVPAESLDGFLFPDVYAFPLGASELEVAARLVERFQATAPVSTFPGGVGAARDLVIIAGLLEGAPAPRKDWPLYASLLWTRRRAGQALVPTPAARDGRDRVIFGPFDRREAEVHGPARPNPGLDALRAAARPADPPARFLVRRDDGGLYFCGDLDCFYAALRGL
jgi:UPF0755 protein